MTEEISAVFVETKDRRSSDWSWSTVKRATPADVERLTEQGCDHDNPDRTEQLIQDTAGFPYDIRHCAICGQHLGYI